MQGAAVGQKARSFTPLLFLAFLNGDMSVSSMTTHQSPKHDASLLASYDDLLRLRRSSPEGNAKK